MPQLDITTFAPQIFWLAVSFVVLYVLMSRLALPRIGAILAARSGQIEGDLDAARRLKAEAEAAVAAYEKALSGLPAPAGQSRGQGLPRPPGARPFARGSVVYPAEALIPAPNSDVSSDRPVTSPAARG